MKKPARSTADAPSAASAGEVSSPWSADEAAVLRRIVEGTAGATGEVFFQSLVRHLSGAVDARYSFVAEFAGSDKTHARTLAFWARDRIVENIEWELRGTPCEDVYRTGLCHHPTGVSQKYPQDEPMVKMGIESYLGVPLLGASGEVLGHLAVFDERPMGPEPHRLPVFRIFAARAAAELERMRVEEMLRASEKRFRDLYEEAPIAYIYEDTESRFVSANRAAMQLLGLKPEEVGGTLGLSLVAPTAEAQERVQQAIADIQAGKERACLELELRRKDDGRPVWVQWWSKPEPDGKFTRTMLVDITARVLAERERARLEQQNLYLQEEIKSEYDFEEIIGSAPPLEKVLRQVEQVAPTDSTVLIAGETGTGKELIARAIHSRSRRKDRPLIKLNCASLPAGLVESELFGHEKGAFTGAIEKRVGRFALADGGTIFLDEIGEMSAEVQVKLLRVLQEQEFEAVGSPKTTRVDVRVVAATNRDLASAVAEGTFRADLYYRLNVFPISLPPLRERAGDIPLLVHYFTSKYALKIGRSIQRVAPGTLELLAAYKWPGNIRELENIIERAVILCAGPVLEIDPDVLRAQAPRPSPPAPGGAPTSAHGGAPPDDGGGTLAERERRQILAMLEKTRWVIEGPRGAATLLGLHPNTLRSRMKKLGLRRSGEGV